MMERFLQFRETKVWKALVRLQEVFLVVCGTLCVLLFVAEVVARYILKIDFRGYDEIVLLFAIWLYFMGGSYAMYKKEHISADMLGLILKGRTLETARVIVAWATFIITVFLAVWGVSFFHYAITHVARTTVWKIPRVAGQSALTVGYILMACYALIYALEDSFRWLSRRGSKGAGAVQAGESEVIEA